MKIEQVNEENYKTLVEWWQSHGWPVVPFDMLPRIGYIINDEVAGFVYSSDSSICTMEWIISNPNSTKESRKENLNLLIDFLSGIAKDLGYKACFTYTKNKGLIDKLILNDFIETDSEMKHFIKRL